MSITQKCFGLKEKDKLIRLPDSAIKNYCSDMQEGFDIDLEKLPPHIKKLRFYTEW